MNGQQWRHGRQSSHEGPEQHGVCPERCGPCSASVSCMPLRVWEVPVLCVLRHWACTHHPLPFVIPWLLWFFFITLKKVWLVLSLVPAASLPWRSVCRGGCLGVNEWTVSRFSCRTARLQQGIMPTSVHGRAKRSSRTIFSLWKGPEASRYQLELKHTCLWTCQLEKNTQHEWIMSYCLTKALG